MHRDFKGVWIPKDIYLDTSLSWVEKALIVEINSLDKGDKYGCFASNEYLGDFIQKSPKTTANMIVKLKKRGYIKQVYFDGRKRGLRVLSHPENGIVAISNLDTENRKSDSSIPENGIAAFTKTGKQHSRKREHSNTLNNTFINTESKGSSSSGDDTKKMMAKSILLETNPTLETEKKECPPPVPAAPLQKSEDLPPHEQLREKLLKYFKNPDNAQTVKNAAMSHVENLSTEINAFIDFYIKIGRFDYLSNWNNGGTMHFNSTIANWLKKAKYKNEKASTPKPKNGHTTPRIIKSSLIDPNDGWG